MSPRLPITIRSQEKFWAASMISWAASPAPISNVRASSAARSRPTAATVAPAFAKASAEARPMPLEAPVTMAVLLVRGMAQHILCHTT